MAETTTISEAAQALMRRRLAGEWVAVTEENRPLYRELMTAGLVYPVSTFLHGKEGNYRPTEAAVAIWEQAGINGSARADRTSRRKGRPSRLDSSRRNLD